MSTQVQDFLNRGVLPTVDILEQKQEEKVEAKEEKVLFVKDDLVETYEEENKKKEVRDFVNHYRGRYNHFRNLLMSRTELQGAVSINRLLGKNSREFVATIGIVKDRDITRNGNIILKLEDPTGEITVICTQRSNCFEDAKDICHDEVIGITGMTGDKVVFLQNYYFPDVNLSNELKKSDKEEYLVFTTDIHYGAKKFYEKEFKNFTKWLNGEYGGEDIRKIGSKVKDVFIIGDIVEGVGIYPNQNEDLAIEDIYEQYDGITNIFKEIRTDVNLYMIGGNHDSLRLSEPQPPLPKEIAKQLHKLPNVFPLSNPSSVSIGKTETFPGFNILMYHGYSMYYLSENIPSIKDAGGMNRADLIMQYMLKRRHLAPPYSSALFVPDTRGDPLIIRKTPDFFATGHIHKISIGNYRNVTTLQCGCWVGQTDYQEKQGMVPDPCKIIVVNTATRAVKIIDFLEENG
jgi:DNA polymerase II small subunit